MQNAILAVLQEAKRQGVRGISKTALVKWIYLLDCLHAESSQGEIASGAHWYFHHYGPFAVDLVEALDELSARSMLQSTTGGAKGRDSTLYWLGEYLGGPDLTALGLSPSLASRFGTLFKKYAGDRGQLLDYVYFKTAPMRDAKPERALSFQAMADEAGDRASPHARQRPTQDDAHAPTKLSSEATLRRAALSNAGILGAPPNLRRGFCARDRTY